MKQDAAIVIEHQSRPIPELKRRGVRPLQNQQRLPGIMQSGRFYKRPPQALR